MMPLLTEIKATASPQRMALNVLAAFPVVAATQTLVAADAVTPLQQTPIIFNDWQLTAAPTSYDETRLSATQLRSEFQALANRWHRETDVLSSPASILSHRAYQEILALGGSAIPHILRDLETRGGEWFEALAILTHATPVPDDAAGDVPRMTEAWLTWGRDNGYIS
jgi:hypothetical protein